MSARRLLGVPVGKLTIKIVQPRECVPVDASLKRYCRGCRRMMPSADFGTVPLKSNGQTIRLGRCKACTGKAQARAARP